MLYWGKNSLHPTDVAGELSPHVAGSADLDCPLYSALFADLTDVFHRAGPAGGVEEKGGGRQLWAARWISPVDLPVDGWILVTIGDWSMKENLLAVQEEPENNKLLTI